MESQLGFLVEAGKINLDFLIVEGKTIPWCEGEKLIWIFLLQKERLFLGVKEIYIPC